MDTTVSQLSWLVLLPQLPAKPDYLRVKLQRRLQRLGAVLIKNGVYALPLNDETTEASEWLREELVKDEGDLVVFGSVLCAGLTDAELVNRFQEARAEGYRELTADGRAALALTGQEERRSELTRLRRVMASAESVDFFGTPERDEAQLVLSSLERSIADAEADAGEPAPIPRVHGLVWVTRAGVFVDRMASAWLIRRFIDRAATFKFVDGNKPYAATDGELRFDMYRGEFTHEGDRCTFETLMSRFGLSDPALRAIAEIVHDLDCKDEKFGRAETAGVLVFLQGIRTTEADDLNRLKRGAQLFDTLYAQFSERA